MVHQAYKEMDRLGQQRTRSILRQENATISIGFGLDKPIAPMPYLRARHFGSKDIVQNRLVPSDAERSPSRRDFLRTSLALASGPSATSPLFIAANAQPVGDNSLPARDEELRSVIIDTDPGQDDAMAILFALGANKLLDVKAITAVAGNVPLPLTERNARIIRDWADRTHSLPVYAGCPGPLQRTLVTAADVHGRTGLEGVDLHDPRAPKEPVHAVAYLVDTLRAAQPHSVTLVAIGPLTNLATALIEAPDIIQGVREIVMMGGAYFERGNITPAAEFNIYVDPEAARTVFACGVPITVLPRDVAVKAPITPARIAPFRALKKHCGAIVADLMAAEVAYQERRRGIQSAPMYDPIAIGYLVNPALYTGRKVNVEIETAGEWTLGETVVDWTGRSTRAPNAVWITEVDADGFYAELQACIANLP